MKNAEKMKKVLTMATNGDRLTKLSEEIGSEKEII